MARINDNLAYEYPEYDYDHEEYESGYKPVKAGKPNIEHQVNTKKRAPIFPLIELLTPAIVAVIVLAGVISNQIDVSRLTAEQSQLSQQLAQLQNDCTDLEAQLATKTSVTAVEEYAENTLGLTKLDKSQVEYVEIPVVTVSEVVEKEQVGFFSSVKSWFEGIKEYLGIE